MDSANWKFQKKKKMEKMETGTVIAKICDAEFESCLGMNAIESQRNQTFQVLSRYFQTLNKDVWEYFFA